MNKFIVWNMKERKYYFSSRIWRRKEKERERADGCEKVSAKFVQSYFHCIVTVFDKQ